MPLRILDLRLVLDRNDRVRVSVDGRELVRHDSAADALRALADRIGGRPRLEQLDALVEDGLDDNGPEAA